MGRDEKRGKEDNWLIFCLSINKALMCGNKSAQCCGGLFERGRKGCAVILLVGDEMSLASWLTSLGTSQPLPCGGTEGTFAVGTRHAT